MNRSLFGTDGIRSKVGTEPLTPESLICLGKAIGQWCQTSTGKPTILLGTDTRLSCSDIKKYLLEGLLLYPGTVHDAAVIPTPLVYSHLYHDARFDLGIMISASHNPYWDNGIKLVGRGGNKLSYNDEEHITSYFYKNKTTLDQLPIVGTITPDTSAIDSYIKKVTSYFPEDFLHDRTIVLDCANGALYKIAPALFKHFGATVISIHTEPDGTNINNACGSLHPQDLKKAVLDANALLGIAFDGDGDRLTLVNAHGDIKDGDDVLALLLTHPTYHREKMIVGTSMSNGGLEQYAHKHNCSLMRSDIGDRHVIAMLQNKQLNLGGEPSGHIIMHDLMPSSDGITAALRVAETMLATSNHELETFRKIPQVSITLSTPHKKDLTQEPFSSLVAHYRQRLTNGRLVVRYSGTEPIMRILLEDNDRDHAQALGEELVQQLKKLFTPNKLT